MKVLLVFANPEPKSLTANIAKFSTTELEALGHEVKTTDLYNVKWKSQVDAEDFPLFDPSKERLFIIPQQTKNTKANKLTTDVIQEQEKLLWADSIIFLFPVWWFNVPAIVKGWIDRVFTSGFAFSYGDGPFKLEGKKALIIGLAGSSLKNYTAEDGSNSLLENLSSLQKATFSYVKLNALDPFFIYGTDRLTEEEYANSTKDLKARLGIL